jgi:hypothetical protein
MIGSQNLRPGSFQQHLVARAHQKNKAKKSLLVTLTLTAMVDMFAVLVIFLLQSFSASPELILAKGLQLPSAVTGSEIKDAPVLALAENSVFLDQKLVGTMEEVLKTPRLLADRLAEVRKKVIDSAADKTFAGKINFQADRSIPSTTVSQFINIISAEHFGEILLAVTGENAH